MNYTDLHSPITLSNDIEIELHEQDGEFLGLGELRAGRVALRSSARPMFVEIRSPDAWEFSCYRLVEREQTSELVRLRFEMKRKQHGPMEWMLHEVRTRQSTADWSKPPQLAPDTFLELEMRPVNRHFNGREYAGFSYSYRYQSHDVPIYKILDRATWEIGGHAVGSEFWMRNCFVPSIVRIESLAQFHSTEWFIPDCANPSAFQFLPLQTELQGFSFTASEDGVLCTAPTKVAHVRSLFEKPRGENLLVHLHEHCGDLSYDFSTTPVEVLFSPGSRDRVELANDYEAIREHVSSVLHEELGMEPERVTTYGVIEEWTPADLAAYRREGLPKLLGAGCRKVYLTNHFENNMNTWGVGNMCCTVDHKIADTVGVGNLREFCDEANERGAQVEMWGNFALSVLAWIFAWDKERGGGQRIDFLPDADSVMEHLQASDAPFVRNASNAIEADHYTPVFCVLNLRDSTVTDYLQKRWEALHDETGVEGVFVDSSFNLSSDKFHWVQNTTAHLQGATADQTGLAGKYRPEDEPPAAILSQYRAYLDLMTAFQKAGIAYCNEDLGVFGTHRHGPDVVARLDSLWLWADCIVAFDVLGIKAAGADPEDVFFKGLAYRMMWIVYWLPDKNVLSFSYGQMTGPHDVPQASHLTWLQAFNETEHVMRERTILPGESGVLYSGAGGASVGGQVLWAFEDLSLSFDGERKICDVLSGEIQVTRELHALRHRVYCIH